MKTLRSLLINTSLVIGSILVFFLLLEAGLRVSGYRMHEARFLCLDGIVGNVYCPNLKTSLDNRYDSTIESPKIVTTNSEGMADREYSRTKPAHTVRVALLGDSVTASLYTPIEQKFKSLWEADLSKQLGRSVEIMNFAIDGAGTWDQLQLFHLKGRYFHPDYVILAFYWGNDTWNNVALRDKGGPNPLKDEYPELAGVRKLQVKHRYAIRWLWNHSAAYQYLDTLKDTIEQSRIYRQTVPPTAVAAKPNAPETVVYDPGFAWDSEGWELSRQLILKLKLESEQVNAKLIVFHLPTLDQIRKPKPLPYTAFRAFLDQHGIPNVDAFDALASLADADKASLYISDHWHLSAKGHRFFAEATLPKLRRLMGGSETR